MSTQNDAALALELIPGAYERNTLTHRQPGSMSGGAFGESSAPAGHNSMDDATVAHRELEGGGAENQRRRVVPRARASAGRD